MLPIVDNIVGWFGTVGVLEALRHRAVEGGSYRVRVSLTRVCLWLISLGIFDKELASLINKRTAAAADGAALTQVAPSRPQARRAAIRTWRAPREDGSRGTP
jgi:crotonobetainyl-CoA:carnitine CoA-transferase CaiB-like acyl-CoA transferase